MKLIQKLISAFIVFVAAIFFVVSMGAFFAPDMVMNYLQVEPVGAGAYNSIRSIYGGLNLVFALFLAYTAVNMRKTGLGFIALYMSGFLIGRLFSFVATGVPNNFIINWTVIELGLLVASVLLLRGIIKIQKEQAKPASVSTWN